MIKNIGYFKDYSDNTVKGVYQVNNSRIIEMSMLYNKLDKDVICVPTHYYCNLGCKMCHLTNSKIVKPMLKIKIGEFMNCILDILSKYKTSKRKLLISFMGVGEPLLNLELIEDVYNHENDIKKIGYDSISYALSTMMPNDNILKLSKMVNELNMPLKVHFSLHSPIDEIRKELIPSSKIKVENALNLLLLYSYNVRNNKIIMNNYKMFHVDNIPIEIHYTLINNINDSNKELNNLIRLLKEYNIPIKFIKFNPVSELTKSTKEDEWIKRIFENIPELKIKKYSPPGREVGASCGEFTKHYYLEEAMTIKDNEEFNSWYLEHKL